MMRTDLLTGRRLPRDSAQIQSWIDAHWAEVDTNTRNTENRGE
jgi:hypothetical protein